MTTDAAPPALPPASAEPRPRARTGDVVATVVEIVLLGALGLLATIGAALLVMASDSCGSGTTECDTGLLGAGVLLAAVAPWVALVPAAVWAIARLVRGRSGWWVVLLSVPGYLVLAGVGVLLVARGVTA
ncbi:hypothetical protein [Nocardioides sp. GY 10127]|uniref:hypothetical protein n=1 Tax=Nocardioides sp. GY 10127 TaxID=2569762 RepID=UPI0010A94937|nr:hypothetical protein [Nocardioides sp. GY 10127]TIC80796.1 hypothetical protein E8D37_13115 [Nocardioides sp. GY 10127]